MLSHTEIAKAASVDEKLIRYYFNEPEKLLDAVLDQQLEEFTGVMELASASQPSAKDMLSTRLHSAVEFLSKERNFFKLLVDRVYDGRSATAGRKLTELTDRGFTRQRQLVERGRNTGEFREDFDPRLLYIAYLGLIEIFVTAEPVVEQLFEEPVEEVRARYQQFVTELILRGISSPR
jgi:TetR/AcrR family transcriptional regulator